MTATAARPRTGRTVSCSIADHRRDQPEPLPEAKVADSSPSAPTLTINAGTHRSASTAVEGGDRLQTNFRDQAICVQSTYVLNVCAIPEGSSEGGFIIIVNRHARVTNRHTRMGNLGTFLEIGRRFPGEVAPRVRASDDRNMPPLDFRMTWSGDFTIAYDVVGDGPVDIIHLPGFISNVAWNRFVPPFAAFLESLGSFARVISVDPRGVGASDRYPPSDAATLEESVDDVLAVMSSASSGRPCVFG